MIVRRVLATAIAGAALVGCSADLDLDDVDACRLLTVEQLGELELDPSTPARSGDSGLERGCSWARKSGIGSVQVTIAEGADGLLERLRESARAEEVEIGGYPGFRSPAEFCRVVIGVSDSTTLSTLGAPDCATSDRVIELMLGNIAQM